MATGSINATRYRALRVGLLLTAACAVGGAVMVAQVPTSSALEWITCLLAAVTSLVMFGLSGQAYRHRDRVALERIAIAGVMLSAALVLQRVGIDYWGALIRDPSRSAFRESLAFSPFLYLAAVVVLNSRRALVLCWGIWAVTLLLALPPLWLHAGLELDRDGMRPALVWLLLANPLFILVIGALPNYEAALEKQDAELASMRDRTEVMDKLEESERRFNLVVDSLDVGVWDRWVGPPERRWWSPRFYELLGYSPRELEPTEDHLKALLHPDDRDAVWRRGTEQLQNGNIMDVDFRLKTKHRGYRWFNSHAKSERNAEGRMTRMAGSITDIHDQRMQHDALHMAQAELTRLAYRDTLTDQYNRRYFDEHFRREWERAHRTREPLALLIIDLDHFKAYNDFYGHPIGDRCLTQVAQVLARAAGRSADIVARLGGEEFAVVLPGSGADGAEEVAQRIRTLLAEAAIAHEGVPGKRVTVSIGISAIGAGEGPSPAEMFDQADKALYEVKRRGRDSVLAFDETMRSGTFTPIKAPAT